MRRPPTSWAARLAAAALLAASLALFAGGVRASCDVRDATSRTSSFALAGAGLAEEDAEAALEREGGSAGPIVLWSQAFDQAAAEGRPAAIDLAVLGFAGDARLLAPDLPAWPLGPGECVLSGEASRLLFGADDASGEVVLVGGEELAVAGVVESGRAFALKPGAAGGYARATVLARDADGFPAAAELVGAALGARVAELDYRCLALTGHAALLLYPLALTAVLGALCLRARRERPAVLAARGAALSLAAIGATASLASALAAFGEYFPTRWSDFPAWGEAARAWADGLARVAFAQQGVFDEPVLASTAACLALAAGALAALATGLALARPQAMRERGKHAREQVG